MICVVDSENFFFIINNTFTVVIISIDTARLLKKQKGTSGLCSQLVPSNILWI